MPIRLHKFIAQRSKLSRRKAEDAIRQGRVQVNRQTVTTVGVSISPTRDQVRLDGEPLRIQVRMTYIAYYKPKRSVVTTSDPQGRRTIWEDLRRWEGEVNAAGRLDFDAEGLLLLSNDGEFIQRVTHPKFGSSKVYHAKVHGIPTEAKLAKLRQGLRVMAEEFAPAHVNVWRQEGKHTWLELKVGEGKYHQIKRMCEAIGHPVLKLKRVAIGPITLGRLERGKWRFLTKREVGAFIPAARS